MGRAGQFDNRRPVVEIAEANGAPDGITADTEGAIWVALWGGSAVHRYLPDADPTNRSPAWYSSPTPPPVASQHSPTRTSRNAG